MDSLRVRRVIGRYPDRAVLVPENIEAQVSTDGKRVCVRLDDTCHADFWLEITLDVTRPAGEATE